jgi:hypothetical protein
MPDYLGQLRRRLLQEGCPIQRIHRMVSEVANHREDLADAWRSQGLTAADAQARAERDLGEPQELAEKLAAVQRRSSWSGRHPLVAFGLLPVVGFPVLWALLLAGEFWVLCGVFFGWNTHKLHLMGNDPVYYRYGATVGYGADYVAIGLVALFFCWLARRAGASWAWLGVACLLCSVLAAFSCIHIGQHYLSFNCNLQIHWSRAAVPWIVAAACYLWYWRAGRVLDAAPA